MAPPQKIDERRAERGQKIAQLEKQITRLDERTYEVKSQSGHGLYTIVRNVRGWRCSCPDHIYREVKCKHIWAVEFSSAIRREVREQIVIKPLQMQVCVYCGSQAIVRHGLRRNKNGVLQRYSCRDCGKRFVRNMGFERVKATPQIVTNALQLYFTGESLRNVQKFLRLQGVQVCHQTVWNWIQKYTALMEKYLDKITPQVSGVWRADEMWVKIRGDMKYVFAMMDDETRFWIAQEVADSKFTHDARNLFRVARAVAGKKPQILITDGLKSYEEACNFEYWTPKIDTRTVHIRHITLTGEHHNNKMERMNGEIRDREKVTRSLKTDDSPILTGMQLFHNYIRPHLGLSGRTPADLAGIRVEGKDKWLTLIQNSQKAKYAPAAHQR